jgi:TrmH family RNA methyltransferase
MSDSTETLIRSLHTRKNRERRGLTLAEGVRLVEEVLATRTAVKVAVTAPALEATPRGAQLAAALRERADRVEAVDDRALAGLASTEHPQGVIAVIAPTLHTLDAIRVVPRSAVLVLDAVQDPGNVGTMIRTAWTLGASGVITLPGTAELTNPKALRATMGAYFRLPAVAASPEEALDWLGRHQVTLWATAAGGEDVRHLRRSGPVAVVVGNEGAGVSAAVAGNADRIVGIPLRQGAESLNVGVAAGILLYEVLREP